MQRSVTYCLWLWILLVGLFALPQVQGATEDELRLPLRSALRRENDVFVSNKAGLYHADLTNKTWKKLTLPDSMPAGGFFADEPKNSKAIFYYTKKWTTAEVKNPVTKIDGLYISLDNGNTWRLVSKNDDYGPVFLHPNGSLFATTNAGIFRDHAHLFVSKNFGKDWREITGKIFGEVLALFVDPDHPDLICVSTNSIRGYRFQAANENYDWGFTQEPIWQHSQEPYEKEQRFFAPENISRSIYYELNATLLTYFKYDFGEGVTASCYDIFPTKTIYTFRKDQPKYVQVAVSFLAERASLKLLDQDNGVSFWGVNIITPDGKRLRLNSPASRFIAQSKDRSNAQIQFRTAKDIQIVEITRDKPYLRTIDLGQLYDFSMLGTYQIQLQYDSDWLDKPLQGEWAGSFSGQVFKVEIK